MSEATLLDLFNKVVAGELALTTSIASNSPSSSANITTVQASTESIQVLPENNSRKGIILYNDSNNIVYISFGSDATLESWSIKIGPFQAYENSLDYIGSISAIWATLNGSLQITEFS